MGKWSYFKLLDKENEGKVVKTQGRLHYEYNLASKKWIRSGVLIDYLFADVFSTSPKNSSDVMEISEDEALLLINKIIADNKNNDG